jgi:ABC-type Fe3+/spermidine/putrescine transport system ATPase subunit
VSKQFAGRAVLDRVSLTVARGEFFALVGPSGSGKSTLLKMVSGIEVPDAGTVYLGGRNVTDVPPYRRPVHTVFQNYALFPHLDVAGNVGFPLRVAGVAKAERAERVREALRWVRLEAFAGRRIDGMSGGERQRVSLARALVNRPACVLLDEPLSALDPHLRGQTLELLQETQARLGLTYLYITHDRAEALRAAHRLGILHAGRLQQLGTPEDLYHQPVSPFVASFVGPINWLAGELEADGRPFLRLAGGQRVPLVESKWPAGSRVRLGVRPESVRLGPEGLPARVGLRQFGGATVSLRLEMDGGEVLAAELPGDAAIPAVGEWVRATWAPEAALLFPAGDE